MAQCKGKRGELWYHSIIHYNVKHFKGSYGRPIFWKVKRIYILSRSMEADMFNKRISGLWLYFVVSIGITACSIVMDVALVIKTAERHLIYFIATKLMSLASYCFHFVVHLFSI